jgi:dipeptidyl aminopeptidase/acylaminoacyl peptidase
MSAHTTRIYGSWISPLTEESVFRLNASINYLKPGLGGIFYVQTLPWESNRQALMFRGEHGRCTRVSPEGFDVKTRVHEYGLAPYAFGDDWIFYSELSTNSVIKQSMAFNNESCEAGGVITLVADQNLRFGDFVLDKKFNRLICVREDHRMCGAGQPDPGKVINTLVAIDLDQGGEGEILYDGSDFVTSPTISPDGKTLAWLTWSHPNMPWDNTEIRIADFDPTGALVNLREIPQPIPGSLLQPQFDNKGWLYFLADWTDWWNLYRIRIENLEESADKLKSQGNDEDGTEYIESVYPLEAEATSTPAAFGQRNYAILDNGSIVISHTSNCLEKLTLLDSQNDKIITVEQEFGRIGNLVAQHEELYFIAATFQQGDALYRLTAESISKDPLILCRLELAGSHEPKDNIQGKAGKKSKDSSPSKANTDYYSLPQPFDFDSSNGYLAHGIFYPPCNPDFQAPKNNLPPLLVFIHGGPIKSANLSLDLIKQYWSSRGFAVLEVNHRGSTGYGRKFRQSLYGNWGDYELEDTIKAVGYLIRQERVDSKKIAIRGSSAGGYTVMSALCSCNLFAAGTSYYGISDLEALARDTHKYESHYLDQLLGPYPECKATWKQRSPIHKIDKIQAPLLLLQGLDDRVVPPNQAELIYAKLLLQGRDVTYLSYPGEGHGFRDPANQVHALRAEYNFYKRVFETGRD